MIVGEFHLDEAAELLLPLVIEAGERADDHGLSKVRQQPVMIDGVVTSVLSDGCMSSLP